VFQLLIITFGLFFMAAALSSGFLLCGLRRGWAALSAAAGFFLWAG